jgi:hypothetical protein
MARSTVAPEVKAAALADLHAGEQPAIVAARYKLDSAKVRVWKQRYVTADVTAGGTPAVAPPVVPIRQPLAEARRETLAELVEANLRAKLIATQRIAEHVTRDEWLDKQAATDVAELFAALDRSAVGILDRLAGAHAQRPALPPPDDA